MRAIRARLQGLTCTASPRPALLWMKRGWKQNLRVLADIQARSGATVLCALKAFSMWSLAPLVSRYLSGVCASGLWEARLGREHYGGHG
jgi:carboxynorspermidine decarboxylase